MRLRNVILLGALLMPLLMLAAQAQFTSQASEYRSVSTKRGNVRFEPNLESDILWRAFRYFPVEVLRYRGDWVRIRDFEGDEGWMHKSILSEIPTVQTKQKDTNLRAAPNGKIIWILEKGFPLRVFGQKGKWLDVSDLEGTTGWLHESVVWGAPAPETKSWE